MTNGIDRAKPDLVRLGGAAQLIQCVTARLGTKVWLKLMPVRLKLHFFFHVSLKPDFHGVAPALNRPQPAFLVIPS